MTRHPFRRECDCDFCFAADLNAVLRRFLEQREKGDVMIGGLSPSMSEPMEMILAPPPDRHLDDTWPRPVDPDAEQLYGVGPGYAALVREGLIDPDAEQLAADMAGLADELREDAA